VVRDSPDYYQMKVSIFNDDKKTELIGETWVQLQEVIVPGGGHNDAWHNLNCKGKYAGEIRMEITYYDSRHKQEKMADKVPQSFIAGTADGQRAAMAGPRQPRATPTRRPLPADPTGASSSRNGTPEHTHTPPRPLPDTRPTPPRAYQHTPMHIPEYVQTPSRGYYTPTTHVYAQSPLQAVEYNTPKHVTPQYQHDDRYDGPEYHSSPILHGHSQSRSDMTGYNSQIPPSHRAPGSRQGPSDGYGVHDSSSGTYEDSHSGGNRSRYDGQPVEYSEHSHPRYDSYPSAPEFPVPDEYDAPPSPQGPPPPPPAHRSGHASPAMALHQASSPYDILDDTLRKPVFRPQQQDVHRHSMPSHMESRSFDEYNPRRSHGQEQAFRGQNGYPEPVTVRHSYGERYQQPYRQPFVEDAPSSSPIAHHRNGDPRAVYHDEPRYDPIPPTAPLQLGGRNGPNPVQYNRAGHPQQPYEASPQSFAPPIFTPSGSDVSGVSTYSQHSHQSQRIPHSQQVRRHDEDYAASPGGYVPSLPPTLVAGMDPMIAQEVSERIYTESRGSNGQPATSSRQSHYREDSSHRQSYPHPYRQQEATIPFVPGAASSAAPVPVTSPHEFAQNRTVVPIVKPKAVSPNPNQRIPRKSISPSPVPSPDDGRRLSGVPFGPDDYAALNPHVATSIAPVDISALAMDSPLQTRPGFIPDVATPDKIILHDGREVDASDHLPETSWAPEPKPRASKQPETPRHVGPRPLRQSGHSSSTSDLPSTYGEPEPMTPHVTPGRNRLQKKSNRHSAMSSIPAQSSPLAPSSGYRDNGVSPRSLPRAQTVDFAGENGHSPYGTPSKRTQMRSDYGGYERNSVSGPPIPAKVPINHGPSPQENAWALLEEMKTIDLGTGRARRKNYHSYA
jgi:hypothetical protein